MQNNAPSHADRSTVEYLASSWIQERKIDDMAVLITWPKSQREFLESAEKEALHWWDRILQSAQSFGVEEIENLTKSVDNQGFVK